MLSFTCRGFLGKYRIVIHMPDEKNWNGRSDSQKTGRRRLLCGWQR